MFHSTSTLIFLWEVIIIFLLFGLFQLYIILIRPEMNVRQSMMPNRHTNHRNCSGTQIKSGKFQYLSFVVVFLFLNLLKNKSITKYFNSDLNIINLTSKKLHLMMMIHRHKKKIEIFLSWQKWDGEQKKSVWISTFIMSIYWLVLIIFYYLWSF